MVNCQAKGTLVVKLSPIHVGCTMCSISAKGSHFNKSKPLSPTLSAHVNNITYHYLVLEQNFLLDVQGEVKVARPVAAYRKHLLCLEARDGQAYEYFTE